MSHRTRLIVSIILAVACIAALVTSVPVSLPYVYSYTYTSTETPRFTMTLTTSNDLISYEEFCSMYPFISPAEQQAIMDLGINCAVDSNGNLLPPPAAWDSAQSALIVQAIIAFAQGNSGPPPATTITTTTTFNPITYYRTSSLTTTSTGFAPLFHLALNSSLQPYACTHLKLTGAVLFCMMQFWEAMVVLLIALIALAGLLVYSFVKRRKAQASRLEI